MKIIVLSAHPDDAETGAGGFCARAAKSGHAVLIVHISRAARGGKINGRPEAKVRTAEAGAAARILGVKVALLNFYMGECPATVESNRKIEALLRKEKPEIVLTQWPVDTHPDHQVVGILPLRAYIRRRNFCLVFYEVFTGTQTLDFQPNRYVDISGFLEQKRRAILAHKSQKPESQVAMHERMSRYRGMEMRWEHAEAFHVLAGQGKNAFDLLFDDTAAYGQSGGMKAKKSKIGLRALARVRRQG